MSKQDSDDDYLDLLYKRSANEQPPTHVDQKILAQARANSSANPFAATFKWQRILSVAAVMVLSIYIFFDVDGERLSDVAAPSFLPQSVLMRGESERVQQEKKKASRKSAAKEERHYAADDIAEREDAVQDQREYDAMGPSALSSQAPPLQKRAEGVQESPEAMIKKIDRLLDDGHLEDAKALYKRFKQVFPEYPVPALMLDRMDKAVEVEQ